MALLFYSRVFVHPLKCSFGNARGFLSAAGKDLVKGRIIILFHSFLKRADKLEKEMLKAARDLEFEAAARLRDEIQQVRALAMGTGLAPGKGLEYRKPPVARAGK